MTNSNNCKDLAELLEYKKAEISSLKRKVEELQYSLDYLIKCNKNIFIFPRTVVPVNNDKRENHDNR